jgi:putative ABC transport system ATP-binding protein
LFQHFSSKISPKILNFDADSAVFSRRDGFKLLFLKFMIELKNVEKVVRSGDERLTILHSLSLEIPDGQFISIVGASGSGKSTLLGLIAGLDAPSAGQILIDGEDITKMNEDRLAALRGAKIGFVFQSFHLIPSLTAFENVLIPMEIAGFKNAKFRAWELIDAVELRNRATHYPSQLSGGEQQRIAIARAFANNPKILLADEPTGNLDSKNGRHIFDLMTELHRTNGTTLVLVTHDENLAAQSQKIIRLRDGRIVDE